MTTHLTSLRDLDVRTRSLLGPVPRPAANHFAPMDAVRSAEGVTLRFDLPGVDPASVELTVEGNVLTLDAERSWPAVEGEHVLVAERRQGAIRRQLRLSNGLDLGAVSANFDNGVLTVQVPLAESSRPSRIDIVVGSSAALGSAPVETPGADAPSDN